MAPKKKVFADQQHFNSRSGVPSTVTATTRMYDPNELLTPRASNMKSQAEPSPSIEEVIYNKNPTELFQWINYGKFHDAALHVMEHPEEAHIWISCYDSGKKHSVKWKYLPLHLVCFNPKPSEELVRALLFTFPKAAKQRAYDGNLAIHFLLSVGCQDLNIIELLLNAYPESINKRDRNGQSLFQIVATTSNTRKTSEQSMMHVLSFLRQWAVNNEESLQEQTMRREGRSTARDDNAARVRSKSVPKERTTTDTKLRSSKKRDSLESKLDEALAERDVLREMVAQLKVQNTTHDDVVKVLKKRLSESSDKLREKNEQVDGLEKQIESLLVQLRERDTAIDSFNQEKLFWENEKKDLQVSVEKLKAESDMRVDEFLRDTANRSNTEETLRGALRSRILELEQMLAEERARHIGSSGMDDMAVREARLQARIESLERELLEALGARESKQSLQLVSPTSAQIAKEERDSLKEMNESLQKHIAVLKERCETLQGVDGGEKERIHEKLLASERALVSLKEAHQETLQELDRVKASSLRTESELKSKVFSLEKEAQDSKILQQRVSSMEHELTLAKTANQLLEEQASTQSRRKEKELEKKQQGMQEEFNKLLSYVHDLSSNTYLRQKCSELQAENDLLRDEISQFEQAAPYEEDSAKIASLEAKLKERSEKVKSYQRQLADYKKKTESLSKSHEELRAMIGKNNTKYLDKVEKLTKQVEDLKRRNDSLIVQVKELASENSDMRNGLALMMASDGAGSNQDIKDLSERLKRVAAFLVAVSALQRQIVQASGESAEHTSSPSDSDDPTIDVRSQTKAKVVLQSPRNLVEVLRKKYELLNSRPDERDDIVNTATRYERDIRTAFSEGRDMASDLSRQKDELESIAKELKQVQ